ncbi:sigma 54-interacting transcriptional regulator [Desulfomonile tiedjei]|uniref:PAS domain S-box n=1 Tax=Desulfomonile tiedjei (strain ATCC 49306 / DSM 6799 / DCB-1) TaxID=706587 RepID=I4C9B4_DESTA|nr:sigma 54-interacting transcriptional regulator [Desulfomonile tiedjei]AFM26155.1 PAS domain S-box [Desulfomonile tiedjei DSM 6799]
MDLIRVLIVEDNPVDALFLKEALREITNTKFSLTHAETIESAQKCLEEETFDVITLDLGLPDAQGIETFLEIKKVNPDIPVVVLSGLDDETVAIQSVREGAQDYLLKDKYDGYLLSRSIAFAIERKQAEKALRRAQQRFELALTGADLGWWDWNIKTDEGVLNEQGARILGFRLDEIAPSREKWRKCVHPDDEPSVLAALNRHMEGSTAAFESEHRLRTKNREWVWILLRGKVVEWDSEGHPVRMAGTIMDITANKTAQEAIRQSEQRFRAIFEAAEDYIFLNDRSSKYIDVNPAAERFLGAPASKIIGKTYKDFLHPEDAAYIRDVDSRVLKGESIQSEHTARINGAMVTLSDTKVPLKDDSGQVIGILTIARDITDLNRIKISPDTMEEYPSKAMQATLKKALIAAKTNITILLTGESGSGKDHLAQYVHRHSLRAGSSYFSINCAAIAPNLAESELFGHEKGAFTGAAARKRGMLELAEGGTLLLNEIGELSLPLQSKLLTFLDTKKFTRVGGEKEISVDARLIAATNRDLEKEVAEGRFRQDLFYRLNVMRIEIPPLRERSEDIPLLVEQLLVKLGVEMQLHERPLISPQILNALKKYQWSGNVRELRNVLERALMLSDGRTLTLAHLGLQDDMQFSSDGNKTSFSISFPTEQSLNEITHDLKRFMVNEALRHSGGSRVGAAKLLRISRYSLKHYMNKLGLDDDME